MEEDSTKNISAEETAQMLNVADKRVHFKVHITIFIVINAIMWALWFTLFSAIVTSETIRAAILKVFVCVTLVWLLLVILHYCIAYKWNKTFVEKELKKMRNKRYFPISRICSIFAEKIYDILNPNKERPFVDGKACHHGHPQCDGRFIL